MEILESLRYALRSRVIPGIVPITDFQRQGADAPGVPLYIRETIIEASAESFSQNAEQRRFLCEYDIFADKKDLLAPVSQLYDLGAKLKAEFSVLDKSPDVVLPGWNNIQAWVDSPPTYNAVMAEEDIFELPLIFYVTVLIGRGAKYAGN